jgi:hypothetical protein
MTTKTAVPASTQVVLHVSPQLIKRIPDPHETRRWCYVGTIPALEGVKLLRGTANPRMGNLKSKVAEDIRNTIQNEPQEFHLYNRGMIVSAPEANFDTDNKTLTLENPTVENASVLWGILDGGHTFDVLNEQAQVAAGDGSGASSLAALKDTWIDVKIRVGLTKEEVITAAAANNTSVQLRPWTLANYRGQLALVKQMVVKEMPDLADDIAFKENETNEGTGEERYWDVLDVLQRMTLLNTVLYPGFDPSKHPLVAYSSKSRVLDLYLDDPNKYKAMSQIVGSAFRMPAIVEAKLSQLSKVHGNLAFVTRAKSGEVDPALKGHSTSIRKFRLSDAVLFPIVAALRPLIEMDGGKLQWTVDENQFVDDHIGALYDTFHSFYKDEVSDKTNKGSLSGMGKDARLWQLLHAKVLAILATPKRK